MHEIVHEKRIILKHEAALEGVTYLKGRVLCIDCLEHPSAEKLYDTQPIRKPSDTDPVTRFQILDLYGNPVRNDSGLPVSLSCLLLAESRPMLVTHISADYIQSAREHSVISANTPPQPSERVLRQVLMSRPLNLGCQQGKVCPALYRMPETLFCHKPQDCNLWYICSGRHNVHKGRYNFAVSHKRAN